MASLCNRKIQNGRLSSCIEVCCVEDKTCPPERPRIYIDEATSFSYTSI